MHERTGIFIKSFNANTPSVLTSFSLVAHDDGGIMMNLRDDVSRVCAALIFYSMACLFNSHALSISVFADRSETSEWSTCPWETSGLSELL